MIVKVVDTHVVQGGTALALCDDDGNILPCQSRIVYSAACDGDFASITCTFIIDGKHIRLVG